MQVGGLLPDTAEVLEGGVLRLTSLQGGEAGQYRCTAINIAGSVQALATLTIQQVLYYCNIGIQDP